MFDHSYCQNVHSQKQNRCFKEFAIFPQKIPATKRPFETPFENAVSLCGASLRVHDVHFYGKACIFLWTGVYMNVVGGVYLCKKGGYYNLLPRVHNVHFNGQGCFLWTGVYINMIRGVYLCITGGCILLVLSGMLRWSWERRTVRYWRDLILSQDSWQRAMIHWEMLMIIH